MMNSVCNTFTNVDGCSVVITMTNSVCDSFTESQETWMKSFKMIWNMTSNSKWWSIPCNSFLARSRDSWMNIFLLWMDRWTWNDELRPWPSQNIWMKSSTSNQELCLSALHRITRIVDDILQNELEYVGNSKWWMGSWDLCDISYPTPHPPASLHPQSLVVDNLPCNFSPFSIIHFSIGSLHSTPLSWQVNVLNDNTWVKFFEIPMTPHP